MVLVTQVELNIRLAVLVGEEKKLHFKYIVQVEEKGKSC